MSRQFVHRVLQAAAFAAMLATAWPAAHAQNVTWTGTSSNSWDDPLNWSTTLQADTSLFFTQGNPTFQPSNAPTSGTYRSLNFLNSTFTGPLTLGGASLTLTPAIAGGTTINNANTTAGRNVTIGNNLVLSGSQNWVAASSTNAITIISGNLSGSGTVRIAAGSASNAGTLPNFRLTGVNSSYSGTINFASNLGLLLGSPSAMTGGLVNIDGANLWLTGNTSGSPYTFGIDGTETSGARVGFGSTAGFLMATGGDVYWRPNGTTNYNWSASSGTIRFGGSDGTTPSVFYLGTTGGTFSISGGPKTLSVASAGNAPGRVTLLSSLGGGDGTQRTLTADLAVLTLTAAADNSLSNLNVTLGANGLSSARLGSALEISNQNQLPGGNLNLSTFGTLILKDGASFTRASGTGNGQWSAGGSAKGGFAASGNGPATIANVATASGSSNFDRSFGIGYGLRNPDGTLYANQALTIAQDTNLTAARTVTVASNGIDFVGVGDTRLNRISGNLSGNGALVVTTSNDTGTSGGILANANPLRQGVLVLSGTNTWTGTSTSARSMQVGPGGLVVQRGYVLFDGTASLPNGSISGTSYISAQGFSSNPAGLLFGGGATEVQYEQPANRRFLLGSETSNAGISNAFTAFGGDGGKARVQNSQLLLNHAATNGAFAVRLLVTNGAELALGGTGGTNPFDLIPTSGTSAAGTTTTYGDASGGRELVKVGEGTLVLSNVRYLNTTSGSTLTQFTWRIGQYGIGSDSGGNTSATFDGAVRGLSLSNGAADSSNSLRGLSGPILMRGGVYEIDNSDGNNGTMTATTGTGAGSTFDFARNSSVGSGGFSAFGGNVAVTLNSNSTLASTGDGNGTLGWLGNTGPLMFGSRTASARIELTNPLAARGLRVLVVDNPASALDFALLSGVFSDQSAASNPLTKLGDGLLELSAANTFTGTTTVSAGTLRLANNQALQNSPLSTTGTGVVALTGVVTSPTFGGLVGTTDLSSVITTGLGNISSLTLNVSGSQSYTGAISGTFGVTKTGAGSQTLGGNNSYSGPTTLSTGTLRLAVGSSLTGNIANAGVLQLFQGGATTGTASGLISGTGSLTVDGGVVQLSNPASTYTGSTTILSGVLEAVSIANSGTANFSALGAPASGTATITIGSTTTSGTLRYVGSASGSSNRPFSLAGNGAIEANGGGALTLTGSVSGTGSRTLTLAGTNTGLNTISTISGSAVSVVKDGVGQWVLTGTSRPGGTLTINQGTLQANDSRTVPDTVTIGGTYATGTAAFLLGQNVGAGTGVPVDFNVPAGTQQVLIGGADGSVFGENTITMARGVTLVASSGTVNFRNTWSGNQNVGIGAAGYAGTVLLNFNGELSTTGTVAVNVGTARIGTATTIADTTPLTIGSSLGSATLDLNSKTQNFRNLSFLSGSGGSIVSGTLGIGTAGNAGTVTVTGSNHLISSAVTLNDAATFNVNAASRLSVNSQISGGNGLTKSGAGILELSGVSTYSGATSVLGGRLDVSAGDINGTSGVTVNGVGAEFKYNSATAYTAPLTMTQGTISGTGIISASGGVSIGTNAILSPGNSPGIQAYTTGLTWAAGGTYLWEINDWTGGAGTAFDQVAVSNSPLAITATSGSTFTILITSLSGTAAGAAANFDGTVNRSFPIATSSAGITGFDASKFWLDTSAFQNTYTGTFTISDSGTAVMLNYIASGPAYVSTTYTLAATAAASDIRVNGTTGITATVTNTGTGTADSLAVTGLGVSVTSPGSVMISPTSGTAANASNPSNTVVGTGIFTGSSAGSYTFTPSASGTNVNLGTAASLTSTLSGTVTVWNPAVATTSGSVNLGTVIVGSTSAWSQAISITNSAPNDGFSEKLNAAFGTLSGVTTNSGSIGLLAAGSTNNTAMAVALSTGSVGNLNGTAQLTFQTDGQGTSGLAADSLSPQTVNVYGTVLDHATSSLAGTLLTGTTISLGTWDYSTSSWWTGSGTGVFSIYNIASSLGAELTADLSLLGVSGSANGFSTNLNTYSDIAGGSFQQFSIFADTSGWTTSGTQTVTFTISTSDKTSVAGATPSNTLTVIANVVVVPEPATIAMAGIAAACAGFVAYRRRRPKA